MRYIYATVLLCFTLLTTDPVFSITLQNQNISVGGYSVGLQVPVNMTVEFVAALNRPRFISLGPDNELLIGSRGSTIYRAKYPYKQVQTLVNLGSGYFHSTAYHQGTLYAAETGAIFAAPYLGDSTQLSAGDFSQMVTLPSATGGHSSRTIVAGPDNRLYVGLGISGNCSDEYLDNSYPFDKRRGGVFVIGSGNTLVPYSSGLRNPIGLAFQPSTGDLFATNAGPDDLGYDTPPEVLAKLSAGSFHGMPWFQYYNGAFNSQGCATSTPPRLSSEASVPAALFLPRSTPQGITFLGYSSLGNAYFGDAVVAVHGSWATRPGMGPESRRPPNLSLVIFSGNNAVRVEDLVRGFQRSDGSRFARPSGIAVGADGNIYFTSDSGEVTGLFRLVRNETQGATRPIPSVYGLLLGDS